jgi:TatD DNase family protein
MSAPSVDMHCHLDLYPEPRKQAEAIGRSGAYVLSVTTTPSAWLETRALAAQYPRIKTALGLHPQLAAERFSELSLFDRLLPEARYVGEVGLDGSAECKASWEKQVRVFEHVLASCVTAGGRILTIHSRSAATAVLKLLEQHSGFGVAILHWFSGTKAEIRRAVEIECWFSVGSAMARSKKGRELMSLMPVDRILTETDGPFVSKRGVPIGPAECDEVLAFLACQWGVDAESARARVASNFRKVVSL